MPCSKIYKGCCYIVYAHFCLLVCVDCVPNAVVTWFSPKPFVYTWQSMTRARHMPNIQKSRQQNDESVRLVDNNSIFRCHFDVCKHTRWWREEATPPPKKKFVVFFCLNSGPPPARWITLRSLILDRSSRSLLFHLDDGGGRCRSNAVCVYLLCLAFRFSLAHFSRVDWSCLFNSSIRALLWQRPILQRWSRAAHGAWLAPTVSHPPPTQEERSGGKSWATLDVASQ